MSRKSPQRRILRTHSERALATIERRALNAVVGGRLAPRQNVDPVLGQGMQQLAQAVQSIGQNMAAAKQKSTSDLMQMMGQMAQQRQGGGEPGGGGPGGGAAPGAAPAGAAAHRGHH